MCGRRVLFGVMLSAVVFSAAAGQLPVGAMAISLIPADGGQPVVVADMDLAADGGYTLDFRSEPFTSHFLSMRPFKCLTLAPRLQCRLPYPYDKSRRISDGDLGNLEYDLLFLVKQADEFGVDFWNGRYYRLHREGDAIVGTAMAVDMNILASKPPPGVVRPIQNKDMSEIAPSDTPYPRLRIAPIRGPGT